MCASSSTPLFPLFFSSCKKGCMKYEKGRTFAERSKVSSLGNYNDDDKKKGKKERVYVLNFHLYHRLCEAFSVLSPDLVALGAPEIENSFVDLDAHQLCAHFINVRPYLFLLGLQPTSEFCFEFTP